MLKVLERDYEQSPSEVEKEFPNSRLLMGLKEEGSDSGKLLAVCDSIESIPEFREYIRSCIKYDHIYVFGFFDEEVDDCVIY